MKSCFLLFVTLLFAAVSVSAQVVVITPEKTVYTRSKPVADFKKNFAVTYPKVKTASPALSKKIESAISYKTILQLDIREELHEVQWLEEADFEVNYNDRGLLAITLFMFGSGAYPDGMSKTVVINSKTGERVMPSVAFTDLAGLASQVKRKQKAEIEARIKELREDPEQKDTDLGDLFTEADFTTADLDHFLIDADGVTFIYDYKFPHVIQALEPDGKFVFPWLEIASHIKRTGPLAQFVSK